LPGKNLKNLKSTLSLDDPCDCSQLLDDLEDAASLERKSGVGGDK